jgi:hypothetical protein
MTSPAPIRLDVRGWLFSGLLPLGFAYVTMVLCGRSVPFEPWQSWLCVTLSGPVLFILAVQHVLVPASDDRRALLRNGLLYFVPFVAGLHFRWVGRWTGAHFSLSKSSLAQLSTIDVVMMVVAGVVSVGVGAVCIREARRSKVILGYVTVFAVLAFVLTGITLLLSANYYLHLHHYFLALILMPFVRFAHPVCTVTQGFLAGVYVEGASRWGMDPVWNLATSVG